MAPLVSLLVAAVATAQSTGTADAAGGAAPSEPVPAQQQPVDEDPGAAAEAAAPAITEESGRLLLGASAIVGASDERETDATPFGGFGLRAGWHFNPDLAAIASFHMAFPDQPYLAPGEGEPSFTEQRADLLAVADWRVASLAQGRLFPYVFGGPRYLALRSSVYQPWMFGVLLGGRMEALLHDGLLADAHIGWAHALAGDDDSGVALGSFKTTYLYGVGLALRFAPHFRLRFGYRGETWVLDRTNRTLHGAEVGLMARVF